MTHLESEPCPFWQDGHPIGLLGTCCSFSAGSVALVLTDSGFAALVRRLHEGKTSEESLEFARDLREAVTRLRAAVSEARVQQREAASVRDGRHAEALGMEQSGRTGEMLDEIEAAARWHEKVAGMGSGVRAWY